MDGILLIFLIFQFFIMNVQCNLPTIRQTLNGPVEGVEQMSLLGQKYYAFRGIPFAEPPITGIDPYTGEQVNRRFKAPKPLKYKWTETLKVHNFSHSCMPAKVPNPNFLNQKFSENCLFLNIYVPANNTEKKTVVVFIAGGGFAGYIVSGSHAGPDFLLSEDNIVVTLSHRFGIFGFLNLNYGEYTGNMALKDQQLALKWVYENIENFSGNKNEILLFGQSKGGACVHLQMLNEQSRKYFTRAFSMSGTAFHCYPLSLIEGNNVEPMRSCTKIDDIDKLAAHLTTTDIDNLLEYNLECKVVWAPTIESINAPNAFLTKSPEEIYNSKDAPDMDAMFSFVSCEAMGPLKRLLNKTQPLIKADWKQTTSELPFFIDGFTKEAYPREYDQAMGLLWEEYFLNTVIPTEEMPYRNFGLISDLGLVWGIVKAAMYQANANNRNSFAKDVPKNTFLFRCQDIDSKMYRDEFNDNTLRSQMIRRSVKMITNFARTGNPSIEDRTPFKSCKSSEEIFCTDITNDPISPIMSDIKQQSHYDTWFKVMDMYKSAKESNSNEKIPKSGSKSHKIGDSHLPTIGLILLNVLFHQMYLAK